MCIRDRCARGTNGIYYITEGTNAYISVTATKTEDLGSDVYKRQEREGSGVKKKKHWYD